MQHTILPPYLVDGRDGLVLPLFPYLIHTVPHGDF